MKTNTLSGFAFLCWWWLNHQGLTLAYNKDQRGMPHLAVVRHDPAKKLQFGAFLYPGAQYDLYDQCPQTEETFFTLINSEELWKKVNFRRNSFAEHLLDAINHLKKAEKG